MVDPIGTCQALDLLTQDQLEQLFDDENGYLSKVDEIFDVARKNDNDLLANMIDNINQDQESKKKNTNTNDNDSDHNDRHRKPNKASIAQLRSRHKRQSSILTAKKCLILDVDNTLIYVRHFMDEMRVEDEVRLGDQNAKITKITYRLDLEFTEAGQISVYEHTLTSKHDYIPQRGDWFPDEHTKVALIHQSDPTACEIVLLDQYTTDEDADDDDHNGRNRLRGGRGADHDDDENLEEESSSLECDADGHPISVSKKQKSNANANANANMDTNDHSSDNSNDHDINTSDHNHSANVMNHNNDDSGGENSLIPLSTLSTEQSAEHSLSGSTGSSKAASGAVMPAKKQKLRSLKISFLQNSNELSMLEPMMHRPNMLDVSFMYGGYLVRIRPGLGEFLCRCNQKYDVILFTAADGSVYEGLLKQVHSVLNADLSESRAKIDYAIPKELWQKVYFRSDCDEKIDEHGLPYRHKNLAKLGRELSTIVMVDDNPLSYRGFEPNAVRLAGFWGHSTPVDTQLLSTLLPTLWTAADHKDVRYHLSGLGQPPADVEDNIHSLLETGNNNNSNRGNIDSLVELLKNDPHHTIDDEEEDLLSRQRRHSRRKSAKFMDYLRDALIAEGDDDEDEDEAPQAQAQAQPSAGGHLNPVSTIHEDASTSPENEQSVSEAVSDLDSVSSNELKIIQQQNRDQNGNHNSNANTINDNPFADNFDDIVNQQKTTAGLTEDEENDILGIMDFKQKAFDINAKKVTPATDEVSDVPHSRNISHSGIGDQGFVVYDIAVDSDPYHINEENERTLNNIKNSDNNNVHRDSQSHNYSTSENNHTDYHENEHGDDNDNDNDDGMPNNERRPSIELNAPLSSDDAQEADTDTDTHHTHHSGAVFVASNTNGGTNTDPFSDAGMTDSMMVNVSSTTMDMAPLDHKHHEFIGIPDVYNSNSNSKSTTGLETQARHSRSVSPRGGNANHNNQTRSRNEQPYVISKSTSSANSYSCCFCFSSLFGSNNHSNSNNSMNKTSHGSNDNNNRKQRNKKMYLKQANSATPMSMHDSLR